MSQHPAVIEPKVIQGLRGLFDDDRSAQTFLNDLIETYRDAGISTLADLRAALDRGDLGAVSRQAHKLKGLSRNIGAVRLGDLCARIELGAKDATAAALCGELQGEYDATCAELATTYYRAG